MISRRASIATLIFLAITALLAVAWFTAPWLMARRADSLLAGANNHIEQANQSMSELGIDLLEIEGFTSVESIVKARSLVTDAQPRLQESSDELSSAMRQAGSAAGLPLLPTWYEQYLDNKQQIAEIRLQQLEILNEASSRLEDLYEVAPLVFQSMEEMDRLLGRFQAAMGKMQDSPLDAAADLDQAARSMRAIQQQLDSRYQETGYVLLQRMSDNVKDNAEMAEQSRRLADAIASGDQARVQEAAAELEKSLREVDVGVDYLGLWMQIELNPLQEDFEELQSRSEELDRIAAELYLQRD